MAVSVIVTGQRLWALGALGELEDRLDAAVADDWLPQARDRARCMARHMDEKDKAAAPRG
jgi:hypothetical protein